MEIEQTNSARRPNKMMGDFYRDSTTLPNPIEAAGENVVILHMLIPFDPNEW